MRAAPGGGLVLLLLLLCCLEQRAVRAASQLKRCYNERTNERASMAAPGGCLLGNGAAAQLCTLALSAEFSLARLGTCDCTASAAAGTYPGPCDRGEIALAGRMIRTLEENALHGISGAKALELNGNDLISVPPRFFEGQGGLEWIDLTGNPTLSMLPRNIFLNLTRLRLVGLDHGVTCGGSPCTIHGCPADTYSGEAVITADETPGEATSAPKRLSIACRRCGPGEMSAAGSIARSNCTCLPGYTRDCKTNVCQPCQPSQFFLKGVCRR